MRDIEDVERRVSLLTDLMMADSQDRLVRSVLDQMTDEDRKALKDHMISAWKAAIDREAEARVRSDFYTYVQTGVQTLIQERLLDPKSGSKVRTAIDAWLQNKEVVDEILKRAVPAGLRAVVADMVAKLKAT